MAFWFRGMLFWGCLEQEVYVFAIENGNAVQKNIEIGIQENDRTEIISGLKAGENVVIQGHNRLRDGDSVKTAEKDREAASWEFRNLLSDSL